MNRSFGSMFETEFGDHQYHHQSLTIEGQNLGHSFNHHPSVEEKPLSVSLQAGDNLGKVRWLQDSNTQLVPDPAASEHFVASSTGGPKSKISLWKFSVVPEEDEDNGGRSTRNTGVVEKLDTVETDRASVTDMVALNEEIFAVTTSKGSLSLYKCPRNNDDNFNRIEHSSSKGLHSLRSGAFPCPARAVATNFSSLVTVGEDGSIYESSTATNEVVRSFERADPLSIYCVVFVGRSEIVTGNGGGQLKRWDLREADNKPVQIMNPNVVMNNIYGAISLAVHPSQKHLVIAGYQSGCMDLYDLRSRCDPIANLASDGGSLSELYFHQINPDHFFSCSQTGQVCQWYPGHGAFDMQEKLDYTPDVNVEFLKRGLVFKQLHTSLFPVNSLSVSKHDRLISGGDSGVLFCTGIYANN